MKTYRADHGRCPTCNTILDASTSTKKKSSRGPNPGDYTICIECLTWLVYKDDMTLRIMIQKDIEDMSEEDARKLRALTLSFSQFKQYKRNKKGE